MARDQANRSVRGLVGLVALAAVVAAGCSEPPASLAGIVREPPPEVGHVALPDASREGTPFQMRASDPDGLLLVYFGYAACPDICPTTLVDVRTALEEIGDLADMVDVAFVTVDPERDQPEVVSGYVQAFIDGSHGLRTEDDALLRSAADAFGAHYSVSTSPDGRIDVGHTALLYAVDADGRVLVSWPFGTPPSDMANDLEYLLGEDV